MPTPSIESMYNTNIEMSIMCIKHLF